MKTKMFIALLISGVATTSLAKDISYRVVTDQSTVTWEGRKVVGGAHQGNVKVKDGTVTLTDGKVKSGEVTIDLTSIANEDIKDADNNKKLVNHLNSPDFFDTKTYPTASLTLTSSTPQKGGTQAVKGTLTIRGKTSPIELTAMEDTKGTTKTIKTDFTFDRTKFDVKYNSGKFFANLGDKIIADEVKVSVALTLEEEPAKSARK